MFKTTTEYTKLTIKLVKEINPDIESFIIIAFPSGLGIRSTNNFIITPAKFHDDRWDTDISYKIKNDLELTEIELKYIWDRIMFRVLQTCYNYHIMPFKDTEYIQHLFALAILCIGYFKSTESEYYRRIIKDIMHFISDELSELTDIKGFSLILYTSRDEMIKKCMAANKVAICPLKMRRTCN